MGPYKCPDCGIWWAGLEHRCKWYDLHPPTVTTTNPPIETNTYTVRCNCPEAGTSGSCPLHDGMTYTTDSRWSV